MPTEAQAIQRWVRQSPRKMRLVADLIRGKNVNEAYAILKFTKKLAAKQIAKTLKSAIANADGRPPEGPMLTPETIKPGRYQVVAYTGEYFKKIGAKVPGGYYTKLTLEFDIYDAKQPHHIPFQITPWTQSASVLPG